MKNPGKLSKEELLKDETFSFGEDEEATMEAAPESSEDPDLSGVESATETDEDVSFADAAVNDEESNSSPDGDVDLDAAPSDESENAEGVEVDAGDEVAADSAEPDAAERQETESPAVNEVKYADKTPRGARPKDDTARVIQGDKGPKWVLKGQDGYGDGLPPRPKGEVAAKAAKEPKVAKAKTAKTPKSKAAHVPSSGVLKGKINGTAGLFAETEELQDQVIAMEADLNKLKARLTANTEKLKEKFAVLFGG